MPWITETLTEQVISWSVIINGTREVSSEEIFIFTKLESLEPGLATVQGPALG